MYSIDSNLKRYPNEHDPSLRAWDAADELILSELPSDLNQKKILIVNDSFGALSTTLEEFDITCYSDSYVAHLGCKENGFKKEIINDLDLLEGKFDLVLIKLPKNMSFFEDILCRLSHVMHSESLFICGAMIKHLPKTSFDLINKYIGETRTSLAKKKARLIFANFQYSEASSPYPNIIKVPEVGMDFINHSNLFSREKLDIGTRFFLDNIPKGVEGKILDLGCANGIVGIKAKISSQNAKIIFADESFMAIKSAKENFEKHFDQSGEYHWTNCYEGQEESSVDLVLCNPPFHQGNTVGDFIAWQMFNDAKQALKPGGRMIVIGNRHLGYHVKLKKVFGNSKVINQNKKFVLIESYKN